MMNNNKKKKNLLKDDFFAFYIYDTKSTDIVLKECGRENCAKTKPVINEIRNHFMMHYCIDGEGTFIINDTEYKIKKGDAFLIPPRTKNSYFPNRENPWKYYWIGFAGSNAINFIKNTGFANSYVINIGENSIIHSYFDIASSTFENNEESRSKLLACFYFIFSELIRLCSNKSKGARETTKYIDQILLYIHNNYNKNLSIEFLSKNFGFNVNYFCSYFKKEMGITPKKYIMIYRINKACAFINEKKYSISSIAKMVGFDDPLYFSRSFKSVKKISPKDFSIHPYNKN